jgi:multidrug transporter EmrE-like cation transporter
MRSALGYFYIAATILLTVYGQLIVKWQVNRAGAPPATEDGMATFLVRLLLNPWVLSGCAAAFLASVFWMAVLTKFPLSYAYPFVALTFVFVVMAGGVLFGEPITVAKIAGLALIIAGITVASQG